MEKVVYNKLVRDLVPEELTQLGKAFETKVLSEAEYTTALQQKLVEEAGELVAAVDREGIIKELADISEVIEAILREQGISRQEVDFMQAKKFEKRGGFSQKIMLLWSEDDGYEAGKGK